MKIRDFLIEFERRLQLMDPKLVIEDKLNSDTIFSFINEAVDKFWKTRYSGLNSKTEGLEQSQKRVDDLRSLIKEKTYSSSTPVSTISNKANIYIVEIPEDYVVLLGDTAGIQPIDDPCWEKIDGVYVIKYADTIEGTIETIDRQLENPLSEHKLKYSMARPIRLIANNQISLHTDGKYKVVEYTIKYLAKPEKMSTDKLTEEYTSLPQHTHIEIVKIAVQLYMATKPMLHYSAYSSEVNAME